MKCWGAPSKHNWQSDTSPVRVLCDFIISQMEMPLFCQHGDTWLGESELKVSNARFHLNIAHQYMDWLLSQPKKKWFGPVQNTIEPIGSAVGSNWPSGGFGGLNWTSSGFFLLGKGNHAVCMSALAHVWLRASRNIGRAYIGLRGTDQKCQPSV